MSDLSKIVDKATDAIVNGQALSTDNLNDLAKIFYASANRIIEAIDKSAGLHREIVQQLPTQDIDNNIIYMVLDSSASGSDIYDEWMWIENAWEHIGSTRVDLSDYYTKTEVDTALSGKANTSAIPTALSQLTADATHRLVTDTEKTSWDGTTSRVNASSSGSRVNITGYVRSERYTCPKDGFLNLSIESGGRGLVFINGINTFGVATDSEAANAIELGTFVKQGMTVYTSDAYKMALFFIPLSY